MCQGFIAVVFALRDFQRHLRRSQLRPIGFQLRLFRIDFIHLGHIVDFRNQIARLHFVADLHVHFLDLP